MNDRTVQPTYPLLERLLVERGLWLKGIYTNKDAAEIFGCSVRTIQDGVAAAELCTTLSFAYRSSKGGIMESGESKAISIPIRISSFSTAFTQVSMNGTGPATAAPPEEVSCWRPPCRSRGDYQMESGRG